MLATAILMERLRTHASTYSIVVASKVVNTRPGGEYVLSQDSLRCNYSPFSILGIGCWESFVLKE